MDFLCWRERPLEQFLHRGNPIHSITKPTNQPTTILPSGGHGEALWNCSTVVSECVASSSAETAMRSFPTWPLITGCPSPILLSCPLPGDLVSTSPRLGGLLVSLSLQCYSCRPFHNKPPSEPPSHSYPCTPPRQAN